jgi:hypothetical protein
MKEYSGYAGYGFGTFWRKCNATGKLEQFLGMGLGCIQVQG